MGYIEWLILDGTPVSCPPQGRRVMYKSVWESSWENMFDLGNFHHGGYLIGPSSPAQLGLSLFQFCILFQEHVGGKNRLLVVCLAGCWVSLPGMSLLAAHCCHLLDNRVPRPEKLLVMLSPGSNHHQTGKFSRVSGAA